MTKEQHEKNLAEFKAAQDKAVKDHIAKFEKSGVLAAMIAQTKATNAQTKAIVALTKTTLTSSDRVTALLDKAIDDAYPDDGGEPDIINVQIHNLEGQTAKVRQSKTIGGIDVDIIIKEPDFSEGSPLDRAMKEIAGVPYDDRHDADDYIDKTAEALAKECVEVQRADKKDALSCLSSIVGLCVDYANTIRQKGGVKKDKVLKDILETAATLTGNRHGNRDVYGARLHNVDRHVNIMDGNDGDSIDTRTITKDGTPLDIDGTPLHKVETTFTTTDGVDGEKLDTTCVDDVPEYLRNAKDTNDGAEWRDMPCTSPSLDVASVALDTTVSDTASDFRERGFD